MNVLIGCEFSGIVRRAFRARGHRAYSVDLLPADDDSPEHIRGDILKVLYRGTNVYTPDGYEWADPEWWDLFIAHPPCTRLANSGVKHLYKDGRKENGIEPQKWKDLDEAVKLIGACWSAKIPKVAIENPIMHLHARQRFGFDPTQIVQPWMFGHEEMKATCLWLRGLPKLVPTNNVGPPPKDPELRKRWARVHRESPGPDRWKRRSITYQGLADAMAEQWGTL